MNGKFSILGVGTALLLGGSAGCWADITRDDLSAEITRLSIYQKEMSRSEGEIRDCFFVTRRWDPTEGGSETLMGEVTVDLRHSLLETPFAFKDADESMSSQGIESRMFREGSNVAHLYKSESDADEDAWGQISIRSTSEVPILREEPVTRERTQRYIERGETWPSPRADGESYVFRNSTSLALTFSIHF